MLTLKLRALTRDGFVDRTVTADVPPKVSYRMTDLGGELAERARSVIHWINARATRITEAREAFGNATW